MMQTPDTSKSSTRGPSTKLFALIINDRLIGVVRAFSTREARGKGEALLGHRSLAESLTQAIQTVEVETIGSRLRSAMIRKGDFDPDASDPQLVREFISESIKAVLLQVVGCKPSGFDDFAQSLAHIIQTAKLDQRFPLSEAFVMWEGRVLATAPSLEAFEARFAATPTSG